MEAGRAAGQAHSGLRRLKHSDSFPSARHAWGQPGRPEAAIDEVPKFGVQISSIPPALIAVAAALSQQTGLLSNDALIVAIMQAHGLAILASEDADFDRVPGINRYAPA